MFPFPHLFYFFLSSSFQTFFNRLYSEVMRIYLALQRNRVTLSSYPKFKLYFVNYLLPPIPCPGVFAPVAASAAPNTLAAALETNVPKLAPGFSALAALN